MPVLEAGGVAVTVVRRPQKNMYLRVTRDGVRVTCPPHVSDEEVAEFVAAHSEWLRRRIALRQEPDTDPDSALLWGERLPVRLRDGRPRRVVAEHRSLVLYTPPSCTEAERAVLMRRFFRSQMENALPPLLRGWERFLGVRASGWQVREMSSRWGSCTPSTGRLRFNLALVHRPKECLEYVVVHELCHLIVADHSPAFWSRVAACLPDWRDRVKRLDR